MPADGLHSEAVDAANSTYCEIPLSELNDQCEEKQYCVAKYKRHSNRKSWKSKKLDSTTKEYESLVEDIQKMRLHNLNPQRAIKTLEKIKKRQKKLKKIAFAQSGFESLGCALLDGLRALIEYMKTVRDVIGEKVLAFLLDLFTTLYNLYKNPTWESLIVNFTSFFSRHFPIDYADYALCWLKSAFEVAFSMDDNEKSYKDLILSFFSNSYNFLNDSLWDNLSVFFVKISSLYACVADAVSIEAIDMETIIKQFKIFKSKIPDIKDVIEMAFLSYEFVLGNWEKIRTGDWTVFILGRDESQEFEIEVRVLEQAFSFVMSNKEIELKDKFNMTKKSYETRLKAAISKAKSLVSRCTSVQQKMAVSNFIRSLTDKQSQMFAAAADAPRKLEAYAIKFSGPSGTGKSTLLDMCSRVILNAYGHDPNERGQVVFTNISEKFESTILPSHKIICADDIANNKNEKPNYDRILNYVNTVPRPLEKADSSEKGIYYPGNDAFLATTNDETLRAMECSSCPESILRRFALDITVEIRDQFRNSYGGLMECSEPNYSVYALTLKRFSHISTDTKGKQKIEWNIIPRKEWNPYSDYEHDFAAMLSYVAADIKRHIAKQEAKQKSQKILDECKFCTTCGCPEIICDCSKEAIAMYGSVWSTFSTSELWDYRAAIGGCSNSLMKIYKNGAFYTKVWKYRNELQRNIFAIIGSIVIAALISRKLAFVSLIFSSLRLSQIYKTMIDEVDQELQQRVDRLSSLCVDVRDHLRNNVVKYFSFGVAILALYKGYQIIKPFVCSQDKSSYFKDLSHLFEKHIDYPRDEKHVFHTQDERDYKEGYSRIPPKQTKISKTTTSSDLQIALAKSLRHVIVKSKGSVYGTVNGILVASNVLLVPSHIIPESFPFSIETSTTPGVPNAQTKDQNLTEDYCYIDRDHDFALVHLASSPAGSDYAQFFPEEYPKFYTRATTLLWKTPKNEVIKSSQPARQLDEDLNYYGYIEENGRFYGTKQTMKRYTISKGEGLKVDLEFNGFGGLCGGLYLDSSLGIIYGLHVAGYQKSKTGFLTCITQPMLKAGLAKIKTTSPTLMVHSAGEIKVDTYGLPYSIVNEKPLYMREDGTQDKTIVTYFGRVLKDGQPLESNARPPYYKTIFQGVNDEFGPRKHRPPKDPNDVAKSMKTLNKLTNPVQHYEGDILKKAIDDYKKQTLKPILENLDECQQMLRFYSQEEALDGIGEFGLGGCPNDTSAGFPINKSKKHCLVRDPMDESLVKIPREFNDKFDIQSEIDRTEHCWSNGLRSETIFKASSKVNELLPTEKALEKVRKFYGSSFANFVASRKKLAGIPRFMRRFWQQTECLVGINPTSNEWQQFYTYLTEYSTTHMIAGDFSGFDTRMAAQVTGGAAQVMISWYEAAGLSEKELDSLRGALSDIIHPNILFDGDLYRFANGNPSGNLITVQLNSICNSIMMRYVYYAMMPNIKEPFAQNVRLGTYGDDNAMSVKHHCRWYTHTSCQKEFERLDIGYTMAEKDAQSVPYVTIDEISFLKRKFIKHETLGKIVAPIEEDSILKKFYWLKKPSESPLSPEEQFGAYTDGAFREVYLYGRNTYEEFSRKIQNIVLKNPSLKPHISFIPYDEMTKVLYPYYLDDYVNDNKKLFAESFGVSEEEIQTSYFDQSV
jgi:energy-coupling factor transporter ATP-binding protein EcfA2